jgi:protein involved in sex pheromone biosynthesis
MKKRFFLLLTALVFVLSLCSCNLESKEVELAATLSYNKEMVEYTAQQVYVEVSDDVLDLSDIVITYESKNKEVAEIRV